MRESGSGRPSRWRLAIVVAVALLAGVPPAYASKLSERNRQKLAAENERAALRKQLDALKQDIHQTEAAKDHAADALAESEQAISHANRALHDLDAEQRELQAELDRLAQEQRRLGRLVAGQQQQLAKLLRAQHIAGGEDRTKLLLSGDNPNRISRELRYLAYVSQAQAKLIESLRVNLEAVDANRAATQEAKNALDDVAREAREARGRLEREKAQRAILLAELSDKLSAQRKAAGNIQRDEKRLGSLVSRLSKLIEEQRRAEAAEARRQQAARDAQRRAQQAKKTPAPARERTNNPDAIDDDEPPKSYGRNELTPTPPVQAGVASTPFGSLRGQLRLPVRGELTAKFGAKREDGPAWKGLFIRTAEGAEVRAVAAGRVVFADWLRGFGNLIIVDHGGQYMTVYGNNQAILKHTGDAVRMGDVIGAAGNSGGSKDSGLYFEMRHQGRAFDPLDWIVR